MDLLFDVIKIALGTKSELPYSPSAIEWNGINYSTLLQSKL